MQYVASSRAVAVGDGAVGDGMFRSAAQGRTGLRVPGVDGAHELARRAEIPAELEPAVGRRARVQIGLDVAAAEPVDRLLRIADHDQAAAQDRTRLAVDAIEDRVLLQVGILELVDQRDRPCLEQAVGERRAAAAVQSANDALDQLVEGHAPTGRQALAAAFAQFLAVAGQRARARQVGHARQHVNRAARKREHLRRRLVRHRAAPEILLGLGEHVTDVIRQRGRRIAPSQDFRERNKPRAQFRIYARELRAADPGRQHQRILCRA
jgi:hypothetical protein